MPICLAWLAFCAAPEVGVRLPAEVAAPPGRAVVLKAETAGQVVRWATLAEGVDLVPFPDGKAAVFVSPTPGRFVVLAWTASGDVPSEAARVVVVVGAPAVGDFAAELRKFAAAEPDAAALAKLAAAYRAAATLAGQPDVTSAGQLAERVRGLVRAAVADGAFTPIRQRVARESAARLPVNPDAALTPEVRRAAATLFAEVATTLEGK